MKNKNTPGPWFTTGWNNLSVNTIVDGKECTITCPGGKPHATKEELQANAKLIAAAPDLLEACMLVNEILNTHFGVTGKEEGGNDAHDSIRKAIKKATE